MFVDIHNHILHGIDDGSESFKNSLEMLKIAKDEGIDKIVATPHFIYGAINNTKDHVISKLNLFKEAVKGKGADIELLAGSEVFISPETRELLIKDKVCRLNDSRYILVEFPMLNIPDYAEDVLFQIQLEGYKPIIAHPERNKVFQQYPDELYKFVERGMLVQVNTSSINKLYGKGIEKVALKFIESNLVHFVATDAHTCRGRSPRMIKAHERVQEICGKEAADNLFINNATAVIENRDFEVGNPVRAKNHGLGHLLRRLKTEVVKL